MKYSISKDCNGYYDGFLSYQKDLLFFEVSVVNEKSRHDARKELIKQAKTFVKELEDLK